MSTFAINSNHISRPRILGAGQILTVTPDAGAYAVVEYSPGSMADAQNGVAEWYRSARGDAIGVMNYQFPIPVMYRVSPTSGNATIVVDEIFSADASAAYITTEKAIRISPATGGLLSLAEGQAISAAISSGTVGTIQLLDANGLVTQTWTLNAGDLPVIGPFTGTQKLRLSCTGSTFDATVKNASALSTQWDKSANGGAGGFVLSGAGAVRQLPAAKNKGASVCDWQANTGALTLSAGVGATAALDSTVTLFGKPTLKCVFSSAVSDTFIATFTPTNPVRLRDVKDIQIPILFTSNQVANGDIGSVTSPFQVWLGTSDGKSIRAQCRFELQQSGVWNTLSFSRATTYITGTGNLASLDAAGVTVTTIKIVQATDAAAANTNPVWVGEIRADTALAKGRVCVVMDGEYISQYTKLYPLLSRYNIRASMAIVTAQIGSAGGLPCMSTAQITEMYHAGHECINHTYEGPPGTTVVKNGGYANAAQWPAASDIAEDIRSQWAFFKTNGWTRGIGYGVWGYTHAFDPSFSVARQALVVAGFKAAGVLALRKSVGYIGEFTGGVVQPSYNMPVDLLSVIGVIQITSTNTAQDVKTAIDNAEATGQLCIITVHRAVDSAPGSLEMLTTDFADWMSYLSQRVALGGVICAPFGETINELYSASA